MACETPAYSIVVPTHNRARALGRVLESLLAQSVARAFEIIVVDNRSSDSTRSVVEEFARNRPGNVRYVREERPGAAAARNAGIDAARGAIVAFVDDDEVVWPDWLAGLDDVYQQCPDAWCVGGRMLLELPKAQPRWFHRTSTLTTAYLSGLDMGPRIVKLCYPQALFCGNLSVRREVLASVGGFSLSLGPVGTDHRKGLARNLLGEEIDLCLRIHRKGGTIYYTGQATVVHVIPPERLTKRYFRTRAYWNGRASEVLAPERNRMPPASRVLGLLSNASKDLVLMGFRYMTRDPRRAFDHELTARFWLGRIHQIVLPGGRARTVGAVGAPQAD